MALQRIPNASTSISLTPPSSYSRRHPDWKPPSSLFFGVPTDILPTEKRKKRIPKENDDARQISISHEEEKTNNKGHVAIPYKSLHGWTTRYEYGRGDGTSFASKVDDATAKRCMDMLCGPDGKLPQKLRNIAIDPRLIELIRNEIMDINSNIHWDDIAGLHHAKRCAREMVIPPLLRPDFFEASPERGLLFFGPPGTGKTMMGKAIALEFKATFFHISASSLYDKWFADSNKLVRAIFGVARCLQPAVIFVDEIDSILSTSMSKRVQTEFYRGMEELDRENEQVLVIGATDRPQDLHEAARRLLPKRFYSSLPCSGAIYNGSKRAIASTALKNLQVKTEARAWIIRNLLEKNWHFELSTEDIDSICKLTEGFSGSDMKHLVNDASMNPLREALNQGTEITELKKEDMRAVTLQDFGKAMQEVGSYVSPNELHIYENWNNQFGSLSPSSK